MERRFGFVRFMPDILRFVLGEQQGCAEAIPPWVVSKSLLGRSVSATLHRVDQLPRFSARTRGSHLPATRDSQMAPAADGGPWPHWPGRSCLVFGDAPERTFPGRGFIHRHDRSTRRRLKCPDRAGCDRGQLRGLLRGRAWDAPSPMRSTSPSPVPVPSRLTGAEPPTTSAAVTADDTP